MKKAFTLSVFLLGVFFLPTFAQTKQTTRKMDSGSSAVARNALPSTSYNEENARLWDDFSSEKYGFWITFPTDHKNVSFETGNSLASFSAQTDKAEYGVTIKNLLVSLNNNQLDQVFGAIIDKTESETTRLVGDNDVYLNGFLGKELVYEENEKYVFTRFYIQEAKLFVLTVSLPIKDYNKSFNQWVYKFFESFTVKSNAKMDS